jgi:hypothetical protein
MTVIVRPDPEPNFTSHTRLWRSHAHASDVTPSAAQGISRCSADLTREFFLEGDLS